MNPVRLLSLLIAMAVLPGCKPSADPVAQHMNMVSNWTAEFRKLYPKPMAGLDKAPTLGKMGEIGPSKSLNFLLIEFPKDSMPELENWLRKKMAADNIQEVRLHGMFPIVGSLLEKKRAELEKLMEIPPGATIVYEWSAGDSHYRNMVESSTVILRSDGTREERTGAKPPSPSFMGKPILNAPGLGSTTGSPATRGK